MRGKGGLYTLSLGLSILSNYYISIMTCMFLCIYFVALCIPEGRGTQGACQSLSEICGLQPYGGRPCCHTASA